MQTTAANKWHGLTVGSRLALYVHQMNRVNSRNGFVMMTAASIGIVGG